MALDLPDMAITLHDAALLGDIRAVQYALSKDDHVDSRDPQVLSALNSLPCICMTGSLLSICELSGLTWRVMLCRVELR
jgi:hypothetical protein